MVQIPSTATSRQRQSHPASARVCEVAQLAEAKELSGVDIDIGVVLPQLELAIPFSELSAPPFRMHRPMAISHVFWHLGYRT